MTNYIEITHEYTSDNWECADIYYAVCPSPDVIKSSRYREPEKFGSGWQLMGSNLTVHSLEDIKGLRKLLDKVEAQLKSAE